MALEKRPIPENQNVLVPPENQRGGKTLPRCKKPTEGSLAQKIRPRPPRILEKEKAPGRSSRPPFHPPNRSVDEHRF